MRSLLAWMFVAVALSGCLVDDVETGKNAANPLEIFIFHYPAEGVMTPADSPYALSWAARVANPTNDSISYELEAPGLLQGRAGIVTADGWQSAPFGGIRVADTIGPGESRLWLFEGDQFAAHDFHMQAFVANQLAFEETLETKDGAGSVVDPGMHVQTMTVGLWINGTSFYTNIPEMLHNASFPAGGHIDMAGALAGAMPLPIYVYDADRSEQPDSSIDNCYFTTIPGYNALLKEQRVGVTGARFLTPTEGYTREGSEEHFLYGDPLVFLNVVTVLEGPAGPDRADPQGDCFDVDRYTPDPIPDITRLLG